MIAEKFEFFHIKIDDTYQGGSFGKPVVDTATDHLALLDSIF